MRAYVEKFSENKYITRADKNFSYCYNVSVLRNEFALYTATDRCILHNKHHIGDKKKKKNYR